MRQKFLATMLTASLAVPTAGMAAPFFTSRGETPSPANSAGAPSQGRDWSLGSVWNRSERATPSPQVMHQRPEAQTPSAGTRIATALKDNPLTRAWSGNSDSAKQPERPQEVDTLSLSRPTGPPTPELLVSTAQLAEARGNIPAARDLYSQALTTAPRHPKVLREVGHFEDRQGNLVAARRYYEQAVSAAPNDPSSLNDLALCLARQGELRESASLLSRAIQLNPQKARYRNNMATVLMELGDHQGAMQQLLAAHPPAVAHYNMGHLLARGSQPEAAASHFSEAVRLDPSMQPAQVALAQVRGGNPMTPATAAVPTSTLASNANGSATAVVPSMIAPLPTVHPEPESEEELWPSQPITPTPQPTTPEEPSFGPRLLPPVR